jgi:hypothetical protein
MSSIRHFYINKKFIFIGRLSPSYTLDIALLYNFPYVYLFHKSFLINISFHFYKIYIKNAKFSRKDIFVFLINCYLSIFSAFITFIITYISNIKNN